MIASTAAEHKCVTSGQYLSTGSDGQCASELDIHSCFESAESVQSRVSRVNAMLSPARHLTSVERHRLHVVEHVGLHCVVHVVVLGLWMEKMTFVGCVCWGHMDVRRSIRVWNTVRDKLRSVFTKELGKQSLSVRVPGLGFWRPLEGLMPVGDELATDPRRVSGKVHVEMRDGRSCATKYGTRLVELGKGCEVVVKIPEKALMVGVFVSPRPGVPLKETWSWKPLLHTPSSGVWILPGALQSLGFFGFVGCGCLLG